MLVQKNTTNVQKWVLKLSGNVKQLLDPLDPVHKTSADSVFPSNSSFINQLSSQEYH